jgi:glutathione peroxidase
MTDIYTIPIINIDGTTTTLEEYKGKVLLIVNVASKCGFTKQYADLEQLQRKYQADGFTVLGFPCNQFLHQEPEDNIKIHAFTQSCYRLTFPLFAKLKVKGAQQSLLYKYLKQNIQHKPLLFIPWNFTKIVVDRNGRVIKQFWPTTSFKVVSNFIEKFL